jgi:hypothetical protein
MKHSFFSHLTHLSSWKYRVPLLVVSLLFNLGVFGAVVQSASAHTATASCGPQIAASSPSSVLGVELILWENTCDGGFHGQVLHTTQTSYNVAVSEFYTNVPGQTQYGTNEALPVGSFDNTGTVTPRADHVTVTCYLEVHIYNSSTNTYYVFKGQKLFL